ncbi:protein-methionine-sulfoxide reductase heme-binding subunit MsrQ [Shimia sp.]|uniref:protein-methionine-sulfoxide reductase heme-binding subunit MsrQ n=1 Tax=Shimia sp. TaxID=1954381 RepID=UPI003296B6CD
MDALNQSLRRFPVWTLYMLSVIYPVWLFYRAVNGGLGVDPVKVMEHDMGLKSLQLMILGLSITPLRRFVGLNLMRFRRAIGLIAFLYICLHMLIWLVLDVQILSQIWADILKRPYITIGMTGFAVLVPLAVTSNNWSVRKLGRRWNKLHKLVYLAGLLGGVHFFMLSRGFQYEPLIYLGVVVLLVGLRAIPRRRAARA